jgi:hypothetical protein
VNGTIAGGVCRLRCKCSTTQSLFLATPSLGPGTTWCCPACTAPCVGCSHFLYLLHTLPCPASLSPLPSHYLSHTDYLSHPPLAPSARTSPSPLPQELAAAALKEQGAPATPSDHQLVLLGAVPPLTPLPGAKTVHVGFGLLILARRAHDCGAMDVPPEQRLAVVVQLRWVV